MTEPQKTIRTTEQALAQQKADAERAHQVPAKANGGGAVTTAGGDSVDNYLAEHAGGGGATFCRFTKDGQFAKTSDDEVIPLGTVYAAPVDKTQVGWIKFNGKGQQPTRIMGPLFGGFVVPSRESLGDTDPALWELSLDGRPKSPWQSQMLLPLIAAADDQLYIFQTTSQTGRNAVGRLITLYRHLLVREPGTYPVIKLGVSGFQHRDPRVGWVKTPAFTQVGTVPMDGTRPVDTSLASDVGDDLPF
jgi:hypothetical protein